MTAMPGRLRKSLSEANYASLILEILVVILGILIAFQIDRWTEQRRERNLEYEYLQRLSGDLRFEISNMTNGIATAERRIESVRFLESVTQNPSLAAEEPETVLMALEKVSWYSFPKIDGFVYYELQNTGSLSVIRSEALRRVLADYYTRIRGHERIAFERDIQFRYDQAVAGILTTDELMYVEYGTSADGTNAVMPERALEIAEELSRRRPALDLLPSIAQYHVFTRKVIGEDREIAKKAVAIIDELVGEFES